METKLAKLRAAYAAGDHVGALRIAAKFPRLGGHREAITRGWAAHTNPAFYRELGHDPAALIAAGIAATVERYGL
jgi:hypothetical protein